MNTKKGKKENEMEEEKQEGKERRKDRKKKRFGGSSVECDIFFKSIYTETKDT